MLSQLLDRMLADSTALGHTLRIQAARRILAEDLRLARLGNPERSANFQLLVWPLHEVTSHLSNRVSDAPLRARLQTYGEHAEAASAALNKLLIADTIPTDPVGDRSDAALP